MSSIQRRSGPFNIGIFGLLASIINGINLIITQFIIPSYSLIYSMLFLPFIFLSFLLIIFSFGFPLFIIDSIYLFIILFIFSTLLILLMSFLSSSSFSKYSFIGSLRIINQFISFSLIFDLILIIFFFSYSLLSYSFISLLLFSFSFLSSKSLIWNSSKSCSIHFFFSSILSSILFLYFDSISLKYDELLMVLILFSLFFLIRYTSVNYEMIFDYIDFSPRVFNHLTVSSVTLLLKFHLSSLVLPYNFLQYIRY